MNKIILTILFVLVSSCAVHKIEPQKSIEAASELTSQLEVTKQNHWAEGAHCKEPLFYLLTLGLIPTHCVDTYTVTFKEQSIGSVKITTMQGWLTVLMVPFASWQFGAVEEPENKIKTLMQVKE